MWLIHVNHSCDQLIRLIHVQLICLIDVTHSRDWLMRLIDTTRSCDLLIWLIHVTQGYTTQWCVWDKRHLDSFMCGNSSCTWMSHVTRVNESSPSRKCGIARTWVKHNTQTSTQTHTQIHKHKFTQIYTLVCMSVCKHAIWYTHASHTWISVSHNIPYANESVCVCGCVCVCVCVCACVCVRLCVCFRRFRLHKSKSHIYILQNLRRYLCHTFGCVMTYIRSCETYEL